MRRPAFVAIVSVIVLSVAASSPGARTASVVPVLTVARPVVPFTEDDVGAATEMEAGDVNGDGLPDVVVTRITYPTAHVTHPIGIFLADGHGGFVDGSAMWDGPPARTEFGRQILVADFNGDRRNDIFVADHGYDAPPFPGHANTLALSTPAGKLVDASGNLPSESGFSHSAAAADVNHDGAIDLFVGNLCSYCSDAPPEILLNDGTGRFTRRTDLLPSDIVHNADAPRFTRSLFLDANGDGAPDLVLGADDHTLASRVLLNDGTGRFRDAAAPLPPKPLGPSSILISLAAMDIDRDGRSDLLAGFTPGSPFYVGRRLQALISNGDGTFRDETAQRLPQQDTGLGWPSAIRVADFNADGLPDFTVVVNHYPQELSPIYLDSGTGVYRQVPFAANAPLFTVVDANADGRPDIFSTFPGGGGGPEKHYLQLEIAAPSAPRGVHAVGRRSGVHVAWGPVAGATGYVVSRSGGNAAMRVIARVVRPSYVDVRARRHITYTYSVRAQNAAGTGPASASVKATRP